MKKAAVEMCEKETDYYISVEENICCLWVVFDRADNESNFVNYCQQLPINTAMQVVIIGVLCDSVNRPSCRLACCMPRHYVFRVSRSPRL